MKFLFFRPIFRSYKPLDDENFGDAVLPDAEPAEVRDKIRDELDKEHEALAVENLVIVIVTKCFVCHFKQQQSVSEIWTNLVKLDGKVLGSSASQYS